jgi:hypothetical protein
MSYRAELACAARWLSAQVRQNRVTDAEARRLWAWLEADLADCRSDGSRELAIVDWRLVVQGRLASRELHRPLEEVGR